MENITSTKDDSLGTLYRIKRDGEEDIVLLHKEIFGYYYCLQVPPDTKTPKAARAEIFKVKNHKVI